VIYSIAVTSIYIVNQSKNYAFDTLKSSKICTLYGKFSGQFRGRKSPQMTYDKYICEHCVRSSQNVTHSAYVLTVCLRVRVFHLCVCVWGGGASDCRRISWRKWTPSVGFWGEYHFGSYRPCV